MWRDKGSKAGYALLESVLSLLLLGMIISTILMPLTRMEADLIRRREEAERWRFIQDHLAYAAENSSPPPQVRISDGQRMEVSFREGEIEIMLWYSSGIGQGEVRVVHE